MSWFTLSEYIPDKVKEYFEGTAKVGTSVPDKQLTDTRVANRSHLRNLLKEYNTTLVPSYKKAKIPETSYDKTLGYGQLGKLIENELAWYDTSGSKVPLVTYDIITQHNDDFKDAYKDLFDTLQAKANENLKKMTPDEIQATNTDPNGSILDVNAAYTASVDMQNQETQEQLNMTWSDLFWKAYADAYPYIYVFFFFFAALRTASLTANELLYKEPSYRILGFVYTFLGVFTVGMFQSIIILYYLYRELAPFIWPHTNKLPKYYSFFPLYPVGGDTTKIWNRLHEYPNNTATKEWIQKKQDESIVGMERTVGNTGAILRELLDQQTVIHKTFQEAIDSNKVKVRYQNTDTTLTREKAIESGILKAAA